LHAPIASWKGVIGAQFKDRSFSALGEEAIIPKTNSRNTNLFLVEERNWDRFRLEFGGRYEHVSQDPKNGINHSRKFNLYTVSVGGLWKFIDGYNVGISATRGQRAPATEELYTNGPHYATETFQTGNQALKKETSSNIDISLRKTTGFVKWKTNLFYNRFNNYICLRSTDIDGNGIADCVDENGVSVSPKRRISGSEHCASRRYFLWCGSRNNLCFKARNTRSETVYRLCACKIR